MSLPLHRKLLRELRRPFRGRRGGLSFADIHRLVGRDDPVILEIGANDGRDTENFLRTFPKGRVFAFEPDLRAIALWRARLGCEPRAQLFELALGASDGEADFYASGTLGDTTAEGWHQSGSLRAPKTHLVECPRVIFSKDRKVAVRTLDSFARDMNLGAVDFIWADVQGGEGDLIAGGRETLARTRYFYTEYSNDEQYEGQPVLAQIRALLPGFRLKMKFRKDALFANRNMSGD